MTMRYEDALARTRAFVKDAGSLIWEDADLQAAIRLALQEINLRGGQGYALSGLDGGLATTLPPLLEGALVLGAAAYAAAGRSLDRAENYQLANEGPEVKSWGAEMLVSFRALLERVYPDAQTRMASQKAAQTPPWGGWADDFGETDER